MATRKSDDKPSEDEDKPAEDEVIEGAGRWTTDEATGDRRWVPEGQEEKK
jgi:hypothetical protein